MARAQTWRYWLIASCAAALSACLGCASREPMPQNLAAATASLLATEVFPDRPQEKYYDAAEDGGNFIIRSLTPVDAADIKPPESSAPASPAPAASAASPEAAPALADIASGLLVHSRIFKGGSNPDTDAPAEDLHLTMARAADGSILLLSSREGARTTTFDPPLIYMPNALEPGVPFEHKSHAEVLGESGRRQVGGRAVRRLEYIGNEAWPGAGDQPPADLRVVRAQLDLDLFPARVVTTTTFWVDSRGVVREQQVVRVRILGVPAETRRHDVILREAIAPTERDP